MNFVRRVAKLERLMVPRRLPRIVLRYEGPGSERFPQPTQEELDEAWLVLSITSVATEAGRPPDPGDWGSSQMTAGDRR